MCTEYKKVKMGYVPGDIHPKSKDYKSKNWKRIRKYKGKAQEKERTRKEIHFSLDPP